MVSKGKKNKIKQSYDNAEYSVGKSKVKNESETKIIDKRRSKQDNPIKSGKSLKVINMSSYKLSSAQIRLLSKVNLLQHLFQTIQNWKKMLMSFVEK